MIKLVAIDLDGTLLNSHKELSEENKQAIRQAKEKGIKVVLCTGRPLKAIIHLLDTLGLREAGDYAVMFNGGLIQHTNTGEMVHQITMSKKEILEIYEMTRRLQIPCNFLDLNYIYEPPYPEGRPSLYPLQHKKTIETKPIDVENMPDDFSANKIVIHTETEILDEAIPQIPASFYDRFSVMKSHPFMLEFMRKDVDKGKGLQQLVKILGIQRDEVMAIGDEENDLEMIQFAGTGVAMANAIDRIKDEAQFITKSANEHGVAYAIENFVLTDSFKERRE